MNSWDYFLSGFSLIFQRGVRRYVVIPLLINIVLFAAMLWLMGHEYHRLTLWLMHFLPRWLHWLNGLLWILFLLLVILFLVYTFSLVANLVSSPFNGFLAEKIETVLRGYPPETGVGLKAFLRDTPRLIRRQLHYMAYYLSRLLLLVVVFFIPGLQVFVTPLWYCLSAWMMAVQYLDYPMDNHKISFYNMRKRLEKNRALNLGFGALVMLASMIPVVNFIVIPAAVAGATHLWVDRYAREFD